MDYGTTYLVLAIVFGLFMAWGIGANDVANAMATSVGSKAITIKQAVIIAAIFEFSGAILAGGQVTSTIRKGIVDVSDLGATPEILIFGMLAALLAAGTWLLVASFKGWPVSTTHSIVGSIVGFAIVGMSMDAVYWGKLGTIVMSWVTSPLLAGAISYMLFRSVQTIILDTEKPFENAKRYVPYYVFLVGFMLTLVTIMKGLKHVGLDLSMTDSIAVALGFGVLTTILGKYLVSRVKFDASADRDFHYANVEKIFGSLMVITACAMAFAHGSNDVANAIGPLAAINSIIDTGELSQKSALPMWILLVGGVGIVLGLAMYGRKVIETVGSKITELTPSRGFCCTISAASTVVLASGMGLPISTTHTMVGAVLGVGMARGISSLNMSVVRGIFMSWIITLPVGGVLAIVFFFMLKGIFA
ncbi:MULTISPECIES: inorganic phosphate transporter [Cycloclasticus]|jgi:PiT family inorganic phosphate transporter|uniref:Phosphate transporter n=1 Tax=Cycloclasticus pugetii TaxID=34068 RepID=A0AB33YZI4_9GAMM|nr:MULTISPECIES: inorganic phosphate transporter [Cycloclasticus]ATI04072.1 inorganic phosphate transporter [Cycloclasticus sp. PY97N]EPD12294.1 phosphate transporter [Cycloclasticus pugetii]MBV1899197.1 inorganic phosphate transporter [Cycloclasticus sp.]MDF1830552.1 inorganic phosphate transporter [Cycloclasticus pugetii]PHR51548.1 MAG: inorganic phosphate transporter [Cycloclasticus sp.]